MRLSYLLGCLLIGISCSMFAASPPQSFEAGKDYMAVPSNASGQILQDAHKVKVVEFFSYGCPACFKLEPNLEKWLSSEKTPIIFERIPVIFEPDWLTYAKTYYIAQDLKKISEATPAIFMAVHVDGLNLSDVELMRAFVKSHGIDEKTFSALFNSPSIDEQVAQGKKITKDLMIFQVPTIVIDGKYKVDPSLSGANYDRMFDVVKFLISKEEKLKTKH